MRYFALLILIAVGTPTAAIDWSAVPPADTMNTVASIVGGSKSWSGPSDYSAVVKLTRDESNLYCHVDMQDDNVHSCIPVYSGDCFMLGVAGWVINLNPRGDVLVHLAGGSLPATIPGLITSATPTSYDITIPAGSIALVGDDVLIDFCALDSDGTGDNTTMGWSPHSPDLYTSTDHWRRYNLRRAVPTLAKQVRQTPPGTKIETYMWPVTKSGPGYCYVEDLDRMVGFRILLPIGVTVGRGNLLVSAQGILTNANGIYELAADALAIVPGAFVVPRPLYISDPVANTGLNRNGLVVRSVGIVTEITTTGFKMGELSVLHTNPAPSVGTRVVVTGISVPDLQAFGHSAIEADSIQEVN